MIELLRNLSNVSTQFRDEFGRVLWGNTRVFLDAAGAAELRAFVKSAHAAMHLQGYPKPLFGL